MPTKTLGQVAYEAYAESTDWKSAISGAPLLVWEQQADKVRAAWEAAGAAARAYVPPPRPFIAFDYSRVFKADELRFSATTRCVCGSGLAYEKEGSEGIRGSWRCAAAMTHTLPTPDPYHGKHQEFPFSMYEIKSEDQPSADGRTTRPT